MNVYQEPNLNCSITVFPHLIDTHQRKVKSKKWKIIVLSCKRNRQK